MKVLLLVLDLLIAAGLTISLLNSKNMRARGTNAVTRFVRDTGANVIYTKAMLMGFGATVLFCLIGLLTGGFWVGLPTLAPVVLALVLKNKSTNDAQRVKDARVVTKGSLEVAAVTAESAGSVVGAVYGGSAGAAIGKAVGNTAGNIAKRAGDSMSDVQSIGITAEDVQGITAMANGATKALVQVANPQAFMQAAMRSGVTDGSEDVEVVAARVYELIPDNAKEAMQGIPKGEQAMLFLEGKV